MRKLICVILSLLFLLCLSGCNINKKITHPCTQEYVVGQGNIKGDVDIDKLYKIDPAFEIGANSKGYAVFKDPHKAYNVFKNEFKDGIKLIRREFHLFPITKSNYEAYKNLGWQVTNGSENEKEQAYLVSCFLDIYENSFK